MDRLKAAVKAGIITEAQRVEIEALDDPRIMRFSMVHVLWAGGVALVVFALVLLAGEISRGDSYILMIVCLVYAAGLAVLDRVIGPRKDLRLLSSLVFLGMGACLVLAILYWQEHVGRAEMFLNYFSEPWWSRDEADPAPIFRYNPLVHGVFVWSFVALAVAGALIWKRGFLPAWIVVCGIFLVLSFDIVSGFGLKRDLGEATIMFLQSAALCGLGWRADLKWEQNHGFWINKVGTFWFGVYALFGTYDGSDLGVLLASLLMIAFSVFIRRPSGLAGGALGVALFLGEWFGGWDNLFVAAGVVGVIGLGTIFLGVRAHLIEDRLDAMLPEGLRGLRPEPREDPVTFGF